MYDFLLVRRCNYIALSCTINLTLYNTVILKSALEVTQGNWNWCHSKAWVRFPIRLL